MLNTESIIQRIKLLMQQNELNASSFAEKIGCNVLVSHILSGRNKPSLEFLVKIEANFKEVSFEWLLKGEKKSEPIHASSPALSDIAPRDETQLGLTNDSSITKQEPIKIVHYFADGSFESFFKKVVFLPPMKKITTLLALMLLYSCYSVDRNCADFHYGTFQFQQVIGDQLQTSTFLRTRELEVEYYNNTIDSASIRWINPCECILTKLNPVSNQDKRPIAMKIISTTKNEYVFEYALVGDQKTNKEVEFKKLVLPYYALKNPVLFVVLFLHQ